jgi:hypothetical protein
MLGGARQQNSSFGRATKASINRSVGHAQWAIWRRSWQAKWPVLRRIVERERHDTSNGENIDDIGTADHRYLGILLAARQAYKEQ